MFRSPFLFFLSFMVMLGNPGSCMARLGLVGISFMAWQRAVASCMARLGLVGIVVMKQEEKDICLWLGNAMRGEGCYYER